MESTLCIRRGFRIGMLCAAVVLTIGGLTYSLAAQPRPVSVSLDGAYRLRLSLRKAEGAVRDAAIATAVENLEPAERKYWAGVLEMMALPEARVSIETAGNEIAIARGDRPALTSAANGTTRPLNGVGELSQKVEGDRLVQRMSTSSFGRRTLSTPLQVTHRYALAQDERTLTVETRIEGGDLTRAIVFSTTYDRT